MGVFSAKNSPNMDVKRNTFPLSFSNNLTMQFGKIYPVFVKPCDPGDSFNIKASFGLNFLPTVYPVQTPMKAYLHFFYCRNRTVWTDFMNFYTMKDRAGTNIASSTYVPPYLDFSKQALGASSLADYMGIPTLDSANSVPLGKYSISNYTVPFATGGSTQIAAPLVSTVGTGSLDFMSMSAFLETSTSKYILRSRSLSFLVPSAGTIFENKTCAQLKSYLALAPDAELNFSLSSHFCSGGIGSDGFTQAVVNGANVSLQQNDFREFVIILYAANGNSLGYLRLSPTSIPVAELQYSGDDSAIYFNLSFKAVVSTNALSGADSKVVYFSTPAFPTRPLGSSDDTPMTDYELFVTNLYAGDSYSSDITISSMTYGPFPLSHGSSSRGGIVVDSYTFDFPVDDTISTDLASPYYDSVSNPNGLKISSLPFRHYEAIYNYFYRDNRNNPLRNSDGLPVYNEVLLPSQLTGGVETGSYDFHYRNWEQDFLTTCVQEPQLGQAPLVGISSTGVASFSNDDGTISNVQLKVAEDGDTVVGFETSEGMTAPVAHSLVELATQGISISDFRNVNAFQTWLEVQMRKTLRFGDSIQGHFNVNPKYDDYLYPEFIGGVTQEIDTYQVNQTSPSTDAPLGSYAGQAICKGSVPRAISRFCDEPGYIIGLLSIVPQPVYSQILPKHYLRRETLDYHFPEFNNISYQPVTYAEVCPVLAFNANKSLTSVFGYQRPWYDLISSLDEAHGQFLTTLNGFILSRRFVSYPVLGDRFLTVHPEDLNDIFSTAMTDSNDVILGQVYFDVVKKTSISKFGIPSLQIG